MTCRIGPEPCRLDFELSDADGEAETDDNVEGTWFLHTSLTVTEIRDCRRGWQFRGTPTMSLKSMTLY
jgi:hypothetical protein